MSVVAGKIAGPDLLSGVHRVRIWERVQWAREEDKVPRFSAIYLPKGLLVLWSLLLLIAPSFAGNDILGEIQLVGPRKSRRPLASGSMDSMWVT